MASMMVMQIEGHMEKIFHMFAYLRIKHNSSMAFDPVEPNIYEYQFVHEDWLASAYGEFNEELSTNAPQPKGIGFTMRAFVDSDHASELTMQQSRTGFIIFLNSSPIHWLSKRQTSVETSSFGSEFIKMKQCCEYARKLQ